MAWPRRVTQATKLAGIETIYGADGVLYALQRGETGYLDSRAEWSAKAPVLTCFKGLGLSQLEAERELWRWFRIPIDVMAVVRYCFIGGATDQLLVGVHPMSLGSNEGRLSLAGGFVKSAECLEDGLVRTVCESVPGLKLNRHDQLRQLQERAVFTFDARSVTPGVAFCATVINNCVEYRQMCKQNFVVPASSEWMRRVMVLMSESTVRDVLDGDLTNAKKVLQPRGVELTQGFAPDIIAPLRDQLDHWLEGQRALRSCLDQPLS